MSVDVLLYAHEAIRSHIRLVARLTTRDQSKKKFSSEVETDSSFITVKPSLKEILDNLNEDLGRHLSFEEEILPDLIGDLLMKAILFEHQKISRFIDEILSRFRGIDPQNSPGMDEGLSKRVDDFIQLLLEHFEIEDTILRLLRRNPSGLVVAAQVQNGPSY